MLRPGNLILTDGALARGGVFQPLVECDDWDAAAFRLPIGPEASINHAVNVAVTGRVARTDVTRLRGTTVVRVAVTLVGDGEPDTVVGGWALARGYGRDFTLIEEGV